MNTLTRKNMKHVMRIKMRCLIRLMIITLIVASLVTFCGKSPEPMIETGGPEKISFRVLPFDLSDVKLLDGPFKHATELNVKALLSYEPDRFLAKFRGEAGLQPKAEHYHGWEDLRYPG